MFTVYSSGFRVNCAGLRVEGTCKGLRVKGQGSRVKGQGSRVKGQGSRIKDQGSRIKGQGSRVWGEGCSGRGQPLYLTLSFGEILWFDDQCRIQRSAHSLKIVIGHTLSSRVVRGRV